MKSEEEVERTKGSLNDKTKQNYREVTIEFKEKTFKGLTIIGNYNI